MRTCRSVSLSSSTRPLRLAFTTSLALSIGLGMASTAAAAEAAEAPAVAGAEAAAPAETKTGMDWSVPEKIASTTLDLIVVRPLAAIRTGVGALLLGPAALLASPGCVVNLITAADCRSVYEAPYEVLVGEPAEYAFRRELGEL